MPDEGLRECADRQTLRNPGVLRTQVLRMLKDPRSSALAENFAGQWLQFRALESAHPDRTKFPDFDDYLRMSMRRETEMFFDNIIRDDHSILDLLMGKYTFLNGRLAAFYGIPGVDGPAFRRVDLTGTPRGGHSDAGQRTHRDFVRQPHVARGCAANGYWRTFSTPRRPRRRPAYPPWMCLMSVRTRR